MEYERENTLRNALLLYGQDHQVDLAIEKMGKLLVIMDRCKWSLVGVEAVQKGIADVKIAMDQLAMIYGEEGVSEFEKKKLERLNGRIIEDLRISLQQRKEKKSDERSM